MQASVPFTSAPFNCRTRPNSLGYGFVRYWESTNLMREILSGTFCPVCASVSIGSLGFVAEVPILMNKLYSSRQEGRAAPLGPLALLSCAACGFTWNSAFREELIVYDETYENDQSFSPLFRAHIDAQARDVEAAVPPGEYLNYLEVGCGQGSFIEVVANIAGERMRSAEGFDPAWRGADGAGPLKSKIYKTYFNVSTSYLLQHPPNVVTTRHTLEHVPDPVCFLSSIRQALGSAAHATIFVETPCVSWILHNCAMQDFFYEHCSLFTAESLALALTKAGFVNASVQHVFGGQYLWARATTTIGVPSNERTPAHEPPELLNSAIQDFIDHWRGVATSAVARGPLAIWGAGAKGVRFAMMTDPEGIIFDHVIDVNPHKQGKFLPGTGLPVLSPQQSAARAPATIIIMNPNYLRESIAMASDAGLHAEMISLNQ